MRLGRTDELRMIGDLADRLFRAGEDPAWDDLAEAGLLGLTLSEAEGGFGGGARAVHAVMRALGAAASRVPLASGALLPALLGCSAGLADGRVRHASSLSGARLDGGRLYGTAVTAPAEIVAVAAGHTVVLAPGGQSRRRLFDGTEVSEQIWEGAEVEVLLGGNAAAAAIGRARAIERLATLSETAGAAEAAVRLTAGYLPGRRQFGVRLADFQALRHRLVDMMIMAQEIEALALHAALSIEADAPGVDTVLAAALTKAARNGRRIAEEAVQLHGGVGVTDEYQVSHIFRRLIRLGLEHGGPAGLARGLMGPDRLLT